MIRRIISIVLTLGIILGIYQITISPWAVSKQEKNNIIIYNEKGEEISCKQLCDMYIQAKKTPATLKIFEDTVYKKYRISGKIFISDDMKDSFDNRVLLSSKYKYSAYYGFCWGLDPREGKTVSRGIFIYAPEKDMLNVNSDEKIVFNGIITRYDDDTITVESDMVFNND